MTFILGDEISHGRWQMRVGIWLMAYDFSPIVSIWQSTEGLSSQTLALMLRALRADPCKRSTPWNGAADRCVLTALTHA